jgi:hypothetical protein
MYRRLAPALLIWLLIVLMSPAAVRSARAEQPFFYYPAYGAQRGRIVYRDGPRVNRQKIRWGNGLTEYGAQVLTHGIDILPSILPLFLKESDVPAPKDAGPIELPPHYTAELKRANDLLIRSARLVGADISSPPPNGGSGGTPEPPVPHPPVNVEDAIRNSPDPWAN